VPWSRVEETAEILESLGGEVDRRRFPGRPHTVLPEELEAPRRRLRELVGSGGEAP
jgi:hypothetical protein